MYCRFDEYRPMKYVYRFKRQKTQSLYVCQKKRLTKNILLQVFWFLKLFFMSSLKMKIL